MQADEREREKQTNSFLFHCHKWSQPRLPRPASTQTLRDIKCQSCGRTQDPIGWNSCRQNPRWLWGVHQVHQDHAGMNMSAGVTVIGNWPGHKFISSRCVSAAVPSSGQSDSFSRMGKQGQMEFSTLGKSFRVFCVLTQMNGNLFPHCCLGDDDQKGTEKLNVISCPVSWHNCWFPLTMMDSGQKISWKMYFSPSKCAAATNALKTASVKGNGWPLKKKVWLTVNYMWQRSLSGHQLKHISVWISSEEKQSGLSKVEKPSSLVVLERFDRRNKIKWWKYSDACASLLFQPQTACVQRYPRNVTTVIHALCMRPRLEQWNTRNDSRETTHTRSFIESRGTLARRSGLLRRVKRENDRLSRFHETQNFASKKTKATIQSKS